MGTLVFQANLGGAINLVGPNTASTVNFTLPSADGTNGQALTTNGSGTLAFATVSGTPGGSNTQVQFNNSGAFGGSANLTFDGTTFTHTGASNFASTTGNVGVGTASPGSKLDVKGTLRLSGSSSGYVGLAPAAAAGSTTYTLPTADGTNGQSLTTNGSGTLSWASSSGGGFSGSTTTSSAVDITLTNTSTQTQAVSMTAGGKFVILPNATTLSNKGGPIFIIQNKGQNPFGIKDAAGNVIANMVYYGQSVSLVLLDNAASAGTWGTQVIGSAGVAGIGPINASTISFLANGSVTVCGLSSTQALLVYANTASTNYQIVLATISGSTVTYGTPTTLYASTAPGNCYGAIALSSSLAVFCVVNNSSVPQLIAASVSGSTITVGTAVALSTVNLLGQRGIMYQESSTNGVVTFIIDNAGTQSAIARAFSVSGTTITLGTAQNLISGIASGTLYCATAKLATGSYVSIYSDGSSGYARPWTISGTTITLGTQTSYLTGVQQATYILYAAQTGGGFGASSTCGVFSYSGNNVTVVISGSTISSLSTSYGPITTFGGTVAYSASIGVPSPFGTSGMISTQGSELGVYTGSANGWGGGVYIGSTGLFGLSTTGNYTYLNSTTNLYAGNYNGLVSAVVVKGN